MQYFDDLSATCNAGSTPSGCGGTYLNTSTQGSMAGTGPYTMTSDDLSTNTITLQANPSYWGGPVPVRQRPEDRGPDQDDSLQVRCRPDDARDRPAERGQVRRGDGHRRRGHQPLRCGFEERLAELDPHIDVLDQWCIALRAVPVPLDPLRPVRHKRDEPADGRVLLVATLR